MKSFVSLLNLGLLLAIQWTFVSAIPLQSQQSDNSHLIPKGYALEYSTISGEINGIKYELNGTINQVLPELRSRFPNINFDSRATATEEVQKLQMANLTSSSPSSTTEPGIKKRGGKLLPPLCIPIAAWGWGKIKVRDSLAMARDMRLMGGRVKIGPRRCQPLACFRKEAITMLCNDRRDTIEPDLTYLASYVTDIAQMCAEHKIYLYSLTGGRLFDSNGYNIITRADIPSTFY